MIDAPTLAETGREAQRARLLATLEECAWNFAAVARALGSNPGNVLRSVRALLPDEYASAKADGRVRKGRKRVTLTTNPSRETVAQ